MSSADWSICNSSSWIGIDWQVQRDPACRHAAHSAFWLFSGFSFDSCLARAHADVERARTELEVNHESNVDVW